MRNHLRTLTLFALALLALTVVEAWSQPLGALRWQLAPFCNVIMVSITAQGGIFALDGFDDQCGAGQRASVIGTAFPNPDGSVGIGLNTVLAPGGAFVHVDARIGLASLSGPWRDSAGNSGTFVLTPGTGIGGAPRPVPPNGIAPGSISSAQLAPGSVGAAHVDSSQVQRRVLGSCVVGQAVRSIGADGSVVCDATASSAITQLTAGAGLTGSRNGGAATLAVSLGYEIVSLTPAVPPGAHTRFVSCPSGKRAVGGGYDSIGPMTVYGSWPTSTGDGWRVIFGNSTASTFAPGIHAICVVVQ